MSFLKKALEAAGAFTKTFTGENSPGKIIINLSNIAAFQDRVSSIHDKLENAKTETEKNQLEDELREAQASLNHYQDLSQKDEERIAQSRDRLSRVIGSDTDSSKHLFREKEETDCPLKNKGDRFELEVGRYFEREGCFVFYNGMLRSEADQGVDLVVYDRSAKVVRYIQCKNWETMTLDFEDLLDILRKLRLSRIIPTSVEIERQQQESWSNGNHFDDSVYYEVEYCLVVPKRASITPDASEKVGPWGEVSMPQRAGKPILMDLYCFKSNTLETWLNFD
jgi:hypothetical protein